MQPTQPGADGLGTLRAAVLPGDGSLVGRFPGVLCLATAAADEGVLSELWQLCADAAAANPAAPGGELARRLAGWLGRLDGDTPEPRFGTIAATEGGLAVFLCGPVTVRVPDGNLLLSGAEVGGGLDCVVPPQGSALVLATGDDPAEPAELADAVAGGLDLRAGTVRGRCVALCPPARPREAPAAPRSTEPSVPVEASNGLAQAERGVPTPPRGFEVVRGLPPGGLVPPVAWPPADDDRPKVYGRLCPDKHLNDPRALFCVVCGARIAARTGVLVEGDRPPLGVLVFEDGPTYTVDGDYLIGRDPGSDRRVCSGQLRPITVTDQLLSVSRAHLEIRSAGWDVMCMDAGSTNGSYLAQPGQPVWSRLLAGRPSLLVPGTRVRIGHRGFVFDSPSAAG